MALRLVFVSLVVGLGVTPPSAQELRVWARNAEGWIDSQLVAWHAIPQIKEPALVFAVPGQESVPSMIRTMEADHQGDQCFHAVAAELATRFERNSTPVQPDAATVTVDRAPNDVPHPVAERGLSVASSTPVEGFEADRTFIAVVEGMAARFATERVVVEVASRPSDPKPGYSERGVDGELNAGGSNDLVGEAEGKVQSVLGGEPSAEKAAGRPQLSHAIRLTREALNAWVNLLQGPATVAIAR